MFCDLRVTTNKNHILPDTLTDLLHILKLHVSSNLAIMHRDGGKVSYFISDVNIDEPKNLACVYITRHDENGSDPAFSTKMETGTYKTKVLEKRADQGNAAGAHLVFHLTPRNVQNGHMYYAAVESSEGLGRSISQSLLRSIFNDIYVKSPTSMMGTRTTSSRVKAESYRPLFDLLGMPVEFIDADLAKGQGVDLKVIRSTPQNSLGRAASDFQSEETVVLKPSSGQPFPKSIAELKKILKAIPGQKLTARFSYRHNGIQQPVHFKFEGESVVLDDLLVQSTLVGPTSQKMAHITDSGKVNSEFMALLKKVLLDKINGMS
jgi:hypothetical protein